MSVVDIVMHATELGTVIGLAVGLVLTILGSVKKVKAVRIVGIVLLCVGGFFPIVFWLFVAILFSAG